MVDPFAWAEKAAIAIAATTQTVGRFAPVLGAFNFPQHRSRLIDFSNPRKRIEKKKPIASYIAAASVGIALLGGGWWWYSSSHATLDNEIAQLREAIKNEEGVLKTRTKAVADWKKVENFLRGDVPWLDELENLSQRAKEPDQAYFGITTFLIEPRTNTASISAKYYAKKQEIVPDVQAAFRDTKHTVKGTAVTQSPDKNYPHASDLTITLAPREVPDPRDVKKSPPAKTEKPAEQPERASSDKTPEEKPPEDSPAKEPAASEGAVDQDSKQQDAPKSTSENPESTEPKQQDAAPATPNSDAVILGDAS
jgi:hypothetical protein